MYDTLYIQYIIYRLLVTQVLYQKCRPLCIKGMTLDVL